jgi:hypothetical protein
VHDFLDPARNVGDDFVAEPILDRVLVAEKHDVADPDVVVEPVASTPLDVVQRVAHVGEVA